MEPHLSFTVPSIHDDTTLDCRLYYSAKQLVGITKESQRIQGAIISHPYAPLGGCQDDPVVSMIVSEMTKRSLGFVCTFNFRGAYGSTGHTSWTGKAERDDYKSVVGFMIEFLRCFISATTEQSPVDASREASATRIGLILGGYSYGSWICSHLPTAANIWSHFQEPGDGTAASEIKIRAGHLANQINEEVQQVWSYNRSRHDHVLSVGGEETSPEKRKRSEDSPGRFSTDLRRSLDLTRRLANVRKRHHPHSSAACSEDDVQNPSARPIMTPQLLIEPAYLLVSPLLPPVSIFTTLPFGSDALRSYSASTVERLIGCPSLAIFGSDDMFTSGRKLRAWAQDLASKPDSHFHFIEVEDAGHFWRNADAQRILCTAVREWTQSICARP